MKKIPYSWLLFGPYALFILGLILNTVVTFANGHQMPVYPPLHDCSVLQSNDIIHTCMTPHTHFKWLGDLFISDDGVASIGDLCMDFANRIYLMSGIAWVVLTIRDIFKQ